MVGLSQQATAPLSFSNNFEIVNQTFKQRFCYSLVNLGSGW